jgi:anti-sigma factor RsiW
MDPVTSRRARSIEALAMTPIQADLTCRELVEFLMAYLDRELPDAQRRAFDAHLRVCADCVAYLRSYEATVRLERQAFAAPGAPVPDDVPEELVAAILASRRPA